MEQVLTQLAAGFEAAFTLWNLAFIVLGVAIGIVFGVLPGVGSITALSILIPITFYMEPVTALAFLIGITKGRHLGRRDSGDPAERPRQFRRTWRPRATGIPWPGRASR